MKTDPVYKVKNTLEFKHVFARLGDVQVNAVNGYAVSGVSIMLTPLVSGTYNLFAGNGKDDGTGWNSTVAGTPVNIAPEAPGTKSNDIYLVPGTYVLTASWTASKGDYTQTFTSKARSVFFAAGKVTKVVASLSGDAHEIQIHVSMNEWTSQVHSPVLTP